MAKPSPFLSIEDFSIEEKGRKAFFATLQRF